MKHFLIDSCDMSIADIVDIARNGKKVKLSEQAVAKVKSVRSLVDKWVKEKRIMYGITTGFGALSNVTVEPSETGKLQENILMSHATGVGQPLDEEIVRAVMAIRLHDLALGHSACTVDTLDYLALFINNDIIPSIPEKGSVGASGDLAPTSHMALPLIGKGEVFWQGEKISGKQALEKIDLKPLELKAGEGLALINGTQIMTAIAALLANDTEQLSKLADIACAMSLEVLMGSQTEFDANIHKVRPHRGQQISAENMLKLTADSDFIRSHKGCSRVQDAYTLRCSPQVHGAGKNALQHFYQTVLIEINSTTTNPLIFPELNDIRLGGNFHGQPIALIADYLAIAIAEWASISERRIERMVNPSLSDLPAFLITNSGLNSGFMIAQYTAAALVSENKVLAHPASVDSIPTSANKEDHVSMGTIAVRKCRDILQNTQKVLAIELLCAAQAYDLLQQKQKMTGGIGVRKAYRLIRDTVPFLDNDRELYLDINKIEKLILSEKFIADIETEVGQIIAY